MPCCMKYGQQRLVAGRKNYIFFLCPLDGEQFTKGTCFSVTLRIHPRAFPLKRIRFRVQSRKSHGKMLLSPFVYTDSTTDCQFPK